MKAGPPSIKALIVDADRSSTPILASLLRNARRCSCFEAVDCDSGWSLADRVSPDIIFLAHAPPVFDAPAFTRALRRSDLAARKTPVVMLARAPTQKTTLSARDAGVHEVLRKPFTSRDVLVRLHSLLEHDRRWIEGIAYVGPDRRRFNSAQYLGARKRRLDREAQCPEDARIGEALKIMKAAIESLDQDPRQAMRALKAQADEIQAAAVAMADFALAGAAQTLRRRLESAHRLNGRQLASNIDGMLGASKTEEVRERKILWVK